MYTGHQMPAATYRNRKAVSIENDAVRVTLLIEGGHVAEIVHKPTGLNPLWTPPWETMEPSAYDEAKHPQYGKNSESKLLSGIMGHNLCLDLFGGPSAEEAAAGLTVHGECSVLPYLVDEDGSAIVARVNAPIAQLSFERRIQLDGGRVLFEETVENLSACDRPVAWTQHVTLGPPFLEKGSTQFIVTATRSRTYDGEFGDVFPQAVDFEWPHAPRRAGGTYDLRVYTDAAQSAGYTAHLMDPAREYAEFIAWSPATHLRFGYRWRREDFPWMGMWEENMSRQLPPWNGKTIARGMEFGVSPMPETRRAMIDRRSLFGVPAYRWLPARTSVTVSYEAFLGIADNGPGEIA